MMDRGPVHKPTAPAKKAPTGYGLFLDECRAAIVKDIGTTSIIAVSVSAHQKWKALTQEEKSVFETQAQSLKTGAEPASANEVAEVVAAKVLEPSAEGVNEVPKPPDAVAATTGVTIDKSEAFWYDAPPPHLQTPKTKTAKRSPTGEENGEPPKQKARSRWTSNIDRRTKEWRASNMTANIDRRTKEWRTPNDKMTAQYRSDVQGAVKEYITKHPNDWSFSLMAEDLSEEKGWESDDYLKAAIKMALKEMGLRGSAAVPQKGVA